MDILKSLKDINEAPKLLREIETNKNTLVQLLANAADEIEKLREENAKLEVDLLKTRIY